VYNGKCALCHPERSPSDRRISRKRQTRFFAALRMTLQFRARLFNTRLSPNAPICRVSSPSNWDRHEVSWRADFGWRPRAPRSPAPGGPPSLTTVDPAGLSGKQIRHSTSWQRRLVKSPARLTTLVAVGPATNVQIQSCCRSPLAPPEGASRPRAVPSRARVLLTALGSDSPRSISSPISRRRPNRRNQVPGPRAQPGRHDRSARGLRDARPRT